MRTTAVILPLTFGGVGGYAGAAGPVLAATASGGAVAGAAAPGEQAGVRRLTLAEAIALGLPRDSRYQTELADVRSAALNLERARRDAGWKPTLTPSASAGGQVGTDPRESVTLDAGLSKATPKGGQLSLSTSLGFSDAGPGWRQNKVPWTVRLTQPVYPLLDRSGAWATLAQREEEARVQQAEAQAEQAAATLRIASAYVAALKADDALQGAQDALAAAEEAFATAQARQAAGELTPLDVEKARLDQEQARLNAESAQADREEAYEALRLALGLPPGTALELVPPAGADWSGDLGAAIAEAQRQRVEVLRADVAVTQAQANLERSAARLAPQVTVTGALTNRSPSSGNVVTDHLYWSVDVAADLPWLELSLRKEEADLAADTYRRAVEAAKQAREAVAADVRARYVDVVQARQRVDLAVMREQRAADQLALTRRQQELGLVPPATVRQGEAALRAAQAATRAARYDYLLAVARLQAALGRVPVAWQADGQRAG